MECIDFDTDCLPPRLELLINKNYLLLELLINNKYLLLELLINKNYLLLELLIKKYLLLELLINKDYLLLELLINKKYLLKRYLPIVPGPFFRIRILYTHFSRIIKATLSSFMHFFE